MKRYFKIIGIIELFFVANGIIINLGVVGNAIVLIPENPAHFLASVVTLLLLIFIAPALGLLFISYSETLPDKKQDEDNRYDNVNICMVSNYKKHDKVVCIDKTLIETYKIEGAGEIVQLYNDETIYVRFNGEKGHYTFRLTHKQIKKLN